MSFFLPFSGPCIFHFVCNSPQLQYHFSSRNFPGPKLNTAPLSASITPANLHSWSLGQGQCPTITHVNFIILPDASLTKWYFELTPPASFLVKVHLQSSTCDAPQFESGSVALTWLISWLWFSYFEQPRCFRRKRNPQSYLNWELTINQPLLPRVFDVVRPQPYSSSGKLSKRLWRKRVVSSNICHLPSSFWAPTRGAHRNSTKSGKHVPRNDTVYIRLFNLIPGYSEGNVGVCHGRWITICSASYTYEYKPNRSRMIVVLWVSITLTYQVDLIFFDWTTLNVDIYGPLGLFQMKPPPPWPSARPPMCSSRCLGLTSVFPSRT